MERGGRALTEGKEADRIGEDRGGEAGEAEAGAVAETPTAPAASIEAPGEDALDEAGEGIHTATAGEHEGPRDPRLWQLLESPGRQLEHGLSLLT